MSQLNMLWSSYYAHSSSDTLEVSSAAATETASDSKVVTVGRSATGNMTSMVLTTTCHLRKTSITSSPWKFPLKSPLTESVPI